MLRAIALTFLAGLIFTASANAEDPEKNASVPEADRAFVRQFAPQSLPKETNPTQRIRQQALDSLNRVEPKEVQPSFTDVIGSIYDGVKETIEDFPAFNFFMLLLSVVMTVFAVPLWRKLHK
jgi:hypothetical protein